MEEVLASLKLSMLTGPNEGIRHGEAWGFWRFAMGKFVARSQEPCGHDLTPTLFPHSPAEGAEGGKLRAVLSAKPEHVRNEIREALLATGLSPKEIEQRLGF